VKRPKGLNSAIPDVHWTRALYLFFLQFVVNFFLKRQFGLTSCGDSSRDVALTVLTLDTYVRVTCKNTHT
jgi:hypothetical protein